MYRQREQQRRAICRFNSDRYLRMLRLSKKLTVIFGSIAVLILVGLIVVSILCSAPADFPSDMTTHVPQNMTLSAAADKLKAQGVIRSPFAFKVAVALFHEGRSIQAGDYLFNEPESTLKVAYRMAYGIQGLEEIKVTIPEGLASSDIARLLAKNIPGFDSKGFLALARPQEGYLFPDTYFFYENVTPQTVVDTMRANFDRQIASYSVPINFSGHSEKEIITMASLVEKEASSTVDRRIIAGILWKRLADNMPLQVDAPFFYLLGKSSSELTATDLATTSAYNLYKHTGLTPTPINNPGTDAIEAALNPTKTNYYYYLSDAHGVTHYAATFDQHVANERKYLQ